MLDTGHAQPRPGGVVADAVPVQRARPQERDALATTGRARHRGVLPSEPAAFSLKPHGSLDFDSSAYSYYAQNISEVFLDIVPNPPQI